MSLHCATPRSANSRNAAGISTFGISNFGISNFGISNALVDGLLVFIFGGVVVVASAMTRSLMSLFTRGAVSLTENFFACGIAARCTLPVFIVPGHTPYASAQAFP